MERDQYNQVIQRLMIIKLEAMGQLFIKMTSSVTNLEECLKTQLSTFLGKVSLTMLALNKCYILKPQENE